MKSNTPQRLIKNIAILESPCISSWPWFVKSQVLDIKLDQARVKKKFLVGGWGGLSDSSISSWPWFVKSQVLGIKLGQAKEY